jgi:hypothetical protein
LLGAGLAFVEAAVAVSVVAELPGFVECVHDAELGGFLEGGGHRRLAGKRV